METWMLEALKIIISLVVTVSVILVTRYVIPKIKEEIGTEKFNKIVEPFACLFSYTDFIGFVTVDHLDKFTA